MTTTESGLRETPGWSGTLERGSMPLTLNLSYGKSSPLGQSCGGLGEIDCGLVGDFCDSNF
jgi:hypothetical protein